jgi:hypothetical protein
MRRAEGSGFGRNRGKWSYYKNGIEKGNVCVNCMDVLLVVDWMNFHILLHI